MKDRHITSRAGLIKISGHLNFVGQTVPAIKQWLSDTWVKSDTLSHSKQNIHLLLQNWARTFCQQLNLNYIQQAHHRTSWLHGQHKYFAFVRFWAQTADTDWLFQWRSL